ncbi:MAG: DUF1330 domain-containing protein [Armatimonadia bacterium]|nr:DUF1330 domain-containing protein [Armatimonadia bacterium]
MSAYVVARVRVTDPHQYSQYTQVTPETIAKYGGRFIARSPHVETLEGETEMGRVVILEFPSVERAKEWYHSPEYTEARDLRTGASEGTLILVEGCDVS